MTTTFPPKPWTEGAVFVNDTTGVSYTYNGNQWLASGGPEVEGKYLPLTGGDLSGKLNINVRSGEALAINTDKVKFWSSGAVALTSSYTNFKDNELVTKAYVDGAIGPSAPSPLKKLRFARDKDWNNLRPGEFGLMNESNGYVGKWSEARQIYFLNVDSDGNRLMPNENAVDFNSYLGSAFTAVTSSGERPVLRVATTGQAGGWVKLDYSKDLDLIYIGWGSKDCGVLMTGTNDNLSNGQYFLFNLPDLFF